MGKKYSIEIISEVSHTYIFEVEADDEEQAGERGLELLHSGDYDPEFSVVNADIVWNVEEGWSK